eukprot:COSAG05_NODE_40_length_27088_cov_92.858276_17_plen_262_part_00
MPPRGRGGEPMPIKLDTRCSCRSGCAGWPGCLGDANASSPQYRGNGLDDAPTGFGAVPGNMPFRTMLPSPSSLAPRQQLGAVVPASFSGSGLFMAPRTAHCTSATSHMSVGVTAAEFIYEAAERLPPDLAVLMEPPYIPEVSISALLPSYAWGRRLSLVLQSDSRSELAVDRLLGFSGGYGDAGEGFACGISASTSHFYAGGCLVSSLRRTRSVFRLKFEPSAACQSYAGPRHRNNPHSNAWSSQARSRCPVSSCHRTRWR